MAANGMMMNNHHQGELLLKYHMQASVYDSNHNGVLRIVCTFPECGKVWSIMYTICTRFPPTRSSMLRGYYTVHCSRVLLSTCTYTSHSKTNMCLILSCALTLTEEGAEQCNKITDHALQPFSYNRHHTEYEHLLMIVATAIQHYRHYH